MASREADFGVEDVRTAKTLTMALVYENMSEGKNSVDVWANLKGWHGDGRFTRDLKVNLC